MDVETLISHSGFIRGLAKQLVQDDEKAEDVAQQTLIAAWKTPPQNQKSARSWLRKVVTNFARKSIRDEGRRSAREERAAPQEPKSLLPEEVLDREILIRSVVNGVFQLREPYRTVVILRFYENLSSKQIAQRTGAAASTVRSQIHRALEELRHDLDHRYEDRPQDWRQGLVPFLSLAGGQDPVTMADLPPLPSSSPIPRSVLIPTIGSLLVTSLTVLFFVSRQSDSPGEEGLAQELSRNDKRESLSTLPPSNELKESQSPASAETTDSRERDPIPSPRSDPPLDPSPTGSLQVTVFWSDDVTPAPGIHGRVTQKPRETYFEIPIRSGHEMNLVSNEDGIFTATDLDPGRYFIYIDRSAQSVLVDIEAGETHEARFTIRNGTNIDLTVVDDKGAGVEGAEVFITSRIREADFGVVLGTTGRDGTYRVRDLSLDGFLGVRARGYAPPRTPYLMCAATHLDLTLELELVRGGGELEGTVRNSAGNPVPGAVLILESLVEPKTGRLKSGHGGSIAPPIRLTTDEKGHYLAEGTWAGPIQILVQSEGYPPLLANTRLSNGNRRELDLILDDGATLTGGIFDPEGKRIVDAKVTVTDSAVCGFRDPISVPIDEKGSFAVDRLPPGPLRAQVQTPDGAATEREFDLLPGRETYWKATLDYGNEIRGRLVDESGAPLAGWRVRAQAPYSAWKDSEGEERERRREVNTYTTSEGKFRIASRRNFGHRLAFFDPTQWSANPCMVQDDVLPDGVERSITIQDSVRPSAFLKGKFTYREGRPISNALLYLSVVGNQRYAGRHSMNEKGEFEVGPLSPGNYELTLRPKVLGQIVLNPISVGPGEKKDLGAIDLGLYGSFSAKVRMENDAAFERPSLRLLDETHRLHLSCTLNGNTATRNFLWPGKYRFCLTGYGQTIVGSQAVSVEIVGGEETTVSATLHPGAKRFLLFEEPPEDPGWTVVIDAEVLDVNGELLWTRRFGRDDVGRLVTSVYLSPGSYQIRGRSDARLTVLAPLEVKGFKEDVFRFRLEDKP